MTDTETVVMQVWIDGRWMDYVRSDLDQVASHVNSGRHGYSRGVDWIYKDKVLVEPNIMAVIKRKWCGECGARPHNLCTEPRFLGREPKVVAFHRIRVDDAGFMQVGPDEYAPKR